MRYLEAFMCAKDPENPASSEDQVIVHPGVLYAVIDGATDISGKRYDDILEKNATGGRLAACAMAAALHAIGAAPSAALPDPQSVMDSLTAAVADLYRRLGIHDKARASGEHRFRAAFAAAFLSGDTVRLMRVGDCGIRINQRPVLGHVFPADIVLSAARSHAWRILSERGVAADTARQAVRQLIVKGLDANGLEALTGLTAEDIADIRRAAATEGDVRAALGHDPDQIAHILRSGLEGVRAAPEDFNALVIDGVSDVSASLAMMDIPSREIQTLEIFSDGYPALPEAATVDAWEGVLAEADRADPERIGPFRSTKGRIGNHFGDDRSIVIAKATMDQ